MANKAFLLHNIRAKLKKSKLLTLLYRKPQGWLRRALYYVSPVLLAKYRFRAMVGRKIDLRHPQTFDEKLIWLMLYWRHPLKSRCADKYAMRAYAEEHGLGHMLPELLGVYDNTAMIDFENLPERFVLKCTHGWGCNIICRRKAELNVNRAKRQLDRWMRIDYSRLLGELHYASIEPRVICEVYLDDLSGDQPIDYKVYCFHGRAHCTMVCTERGSSGGTKFDYYDRNWRCKLPYSKSSLLADRHLEKPGQYEEMIGAAETLSQPFPFVRVDFYNVNGKAVLGEMTFTPAGCIDPGYSDVAQLTLGELIVLPEKLPG